MVKSLKKPKRSMRKGKRFATSSVESREEIHEEFDKLFAATTIEQRRIDQLHPAARNARTHTNKQIAQIASSIRKFGLLVPILVNSQCQIVAGHGRYEAAKLIGLREIPVIVISHLSGIEMRAYAIADNRLAELAGWDSKILALEFEEFEAVEVSFDLDITGFDTAYRDQIMLGDDPPSGEEPIEPTEGQVVSKLGDCWNLGRHRLVCGSALDMSAYMQLLRDKKAQMMFTDPPYNVRVADISGMGRVKHAEFKMASGEMSGREFKDFLRQFITCAVHHSLNTAVAYICSDWRHVPDVTEAAKGLYSVWKNMVVWVKNNAGMGSFYRSQHEIILVFTVGEAGHINHFGLGDHGRYRTNVWNYGGMNSFHRGRDEAFKMHPTVKPLAMVMDAIRDCSNRNGIILDPFGGSGTTLIAAEKTGRIARLLELDGKYVDVIVRRWQKVTGEKAVNDAGEAFDDLASTNDVPAPETPRVRRAKRGRSKRAAVPHD